MSSMLEQAIIDANALKQVALESAEASLIEKYSHEIKEAVETLLEQEVEEEIPIDDFPGEEGDLEGGEPEEDSEFAEQLPSSFPTGDENLGDKVDTLKDALSAAEEALDGVSDAADELASSSLDGDEDEEIEIDFDQLEAEMNGDLESDNDMLDREELADDVVELNESILTAIAEELNVDMSGQRSGWGNNGAPDAVLAHEAEKELAAEQDDAVKEELDSVKKENKKLKENIVQAQKVLSTLKEKLEEVNLSNAKLVYSNKTHISDSLNERQKSKIVDAIAKATTVAEAKNIYETLLSTVGSISRQKTPKSLSETINKNSSTLLPRNRSVERSSSSPMRERMQRLAGIKLKGEN